MASNAAKCRDPARRRHLRTESSTRLRGGKGSATQREGDQQACGHEALGQWQAPVKTETNGRRRLEVTANDATTTKKKPPRYRPRGFEDSEGVGDRRVAHQGRRVMITVDKVLRARGKIWSSRLSGDGNAAMSPDGNCLRGSSLVRQAFPRRVPCPGGVENSSLGVPQEARRQA